MPLDPGQAERSFAQFLTAAGLASISFSNNVTIEEFAKLVRSFSVSGSKAQDVVTQIKDTFADSKNSSIRLNEVKFIAADPSTGDVSIAAQIVAQTLGPEFKDWLNDPQKLLQLIAAAEGSRNGGPGTGTPGEGNGTGPGPGTSAAETGPAAPLEEQEVLKAIRLLTRFGEASKDPNFRPNNM